jgi:hypothetical protein
MNFKLIRCLHNIPTKKGVNDLLPPKHSHSKEDDDTIQILSNKACSKNTLWFIITYKWRRFFDSRRLHQFEWKKP